MPFQSDDLRAKVQSIARTFPQGISLITTGRPNIKCVGIQNRDNKPVYFWHGDFPSGVAGDGAALPSDPATWTAGQLTDAMTMIKAFGEKIDAGVTYQPILAHSGKLYSYVETGTAICHVKQGD
jgi:hypothetical protein